MNKSNNTIDIYKFKKMVEENYSKSEIARTFNFSRKKVVRIMNKENIQREDAWTKKYDFVLNDFQKQVLYGTLLGDACLFKYPTSKYPSLLIYHSISQKEYVKLKLKIFKNFVYSKRVKEVKRERGRRVHFRTCCHKEFDEIHKMFYSNKVKKVNEKILNLLTPISLAFWFSDDGSRCKHRGLAIHTNSFSYEEVELICSWFYEKFEIKCNPQKRAENQWVVFFSNKTSEKFVNMILPFTHKTMRYKFKGIFYKNPQRLYVIPFIMDRYIGAEDIV